jgi:uncharacterized protein YijF (DUF1287 family)
MPRRPVRLLLLASTLLLAASAETMARDRMGLGVATPTRSHPAESKSASNASAFGARLAAVARRQTSHFVFYNPAYMQIAYPMGDVPRYFGVCTDVVVRAYRALGIDLQVQVHKSGAGSGDTNIDHRRVEVLRRFFASRGTSLPITDNPGDYQPGDIVTYYMPNGWLSKTHIAIVAAEKSPTGVPLVVHNRGWGVQAENWLFNEKITGHFRYAGPR